MLIKQWQRIWYAIHTAHSPGTDSLFHLSLTSVWEIQTWHSITCGERSAHWSYIQLNSPQALSCLAYHTTFFSSLFILIRGMSSYSNAVDNSRHLRHDVQWREVHGEGADMWKVHLSCMVFLLCHSKMRHVFEAEGEPRGWLWSQQGKVSAYLCACMCVCSFTK